LLTLVYPSSESTAKTRRAIMRTRNANLTEALHRFVLAKGCVLARHGFERQ
jgi:hypothetical protein